jgi:tetratricopeptide (TPR) repeat protein
MQNRLVSQVVTKTVFVLSLFALNFLITNAQTQQNQPRFDITDYRIEAQLVPSSNRLQATTDVTFVPQSEMRTVTFELNGSLKVENVSRERTAATLPIPTPTPRVVRTAPQQTQTASTGGSLNFVQDQVGVSNLGPSVRVEFPEPLAANVPVTLRFRYAGTLLTPEGGPLPTKRLAVVDEQLSYLMYAARWFPFHDYAADRAAADITLIVPSGTQVVGYSEETVSQSPAGAGNVRYRFVTRKPGLIGNFAAGKFTSRNVRSGSYEVQFFTKPGNDARIAEYGETLGKALQFYAQRFGNSDTGTKLAVVQIDEQSLDAYSAPGVLFLSTRYFENPPQNSEERLQREAAYQWWAHTVGLKSFDDVWLSQGLAEYSALELREQTLKGAELENANRELLERALTFEQAASILRAPASLNDDTAAYQYIMFYKGSAVYRLLRETLGREKFNQLLRSFLNQYRGKAASIDDFEKLATQVAGTNMRYFFARWVEGTGVPEFQSDYQIIRTRSGKFLARGTVKQNYDNLRLPVEVQMRSESGDSKVETLRVEDASEDFNLEANGKPLEVVVDPGYKLLRIDDELRVSSIARRGIEQFKEGNYAEAQQQFEAALKLDRSNSWIYYHLGLLFLEQRNYDLAIDNFRAAVNGSQKPRWIVVWSRIKMGNAFDARGDRDKALAEYKKAQDTGDNFDNAQTVAKRFIDAPYDPRGATASK